MDLSKCKVLSEVEYGSTFQGLADEESDLDKLFLVIQPFKDSIFKDTKNAQIVNEGNRYYSLEKFTSFLLNGSHDSFLLLAAQLKQADSCLFNQQVLKPLFFDKGGFNLLYQANRKKLCFSLVGEMNKLFNKKNFKFNGKELLKVINTLNKLEYFLEKETLTLDEFVNHLNFKESLELMPYKRLEYKDLKEKINFNEILLKERFETLVFNLKSKNWEHNEFMLENELKNKVVEFLVNEYKGEFK